MNVLGSKQSAKWSVKWELRKLQCWEVKVVWMIELTRSFEVSGQLRILGEISPYPKIEMYSDV